MDRPTSARARNSRRALAGLFVLAATVAPFGLWAWSSQREIRFVEVAEKAGVKHTHHTRQFPGKNGDILNIFTAGGASVAVGDYDNDGLDDIFLTDSRVGGKCRLFHNDGNFKFTEVTDSAGVWRGNDERSIVADALWFDYDNDGREDLLVARFGTPILYHNEGNGKFKDVTATSGLDQFANTIAVIAFDYDNDGYLDLLFGNYFQPVNLIDLKTPHVLPNNLDNAINGGGVTLWRNTGKGSFVNVTKKAGLDKHTGWTTDVGHGDLNNDGLQDIYLACDYGTDRMFFNNGDGTFREVTEKAIGFDTRKGMNVDIADYDNDGWMDVYVTNITDEYMKECNMLWHNNGDGTFNDVSRETGTCATLWGWGAKFGDFDNDGWQDLFVVNGLRSAGKDNYIPILVNMIVKPGVDFSDVNSWPPIGNMTWSGYQNKKLFRNNAGGQSFQEISTRAGVDNDRDGRGIGLADFDNDGRLDLFQTNVDQPAMLYRNVTEDVGNWVELLLAGTKSNRDGIGARIKLTAGGFTQIREVNGGNGYAGQSMRRVHFGLGRASKLDAVEIHWPSGTIENVEIPINRLTHLREGTGVVPK